MPEFGKLPLETMERARVSPQHSRELTLTRQHGTGGNPPSCRFELVGLCRGGCSPRRGPCVQIRSAVAHPIAEAVEGRAVPTHAVAVQRAVREAEVVRRAPCIEESAVVVAHTAPPSIAGCVEPAAPSGRYVRRRSDRRRFRRTVQSRRLGEIRQPPVVLTYARAPGRPHRHRPPERHRHRARRPPAASEKAPTRVSVRRRPPGGFVLDRRGSALRDGSAVGAPRRSCRASPRGWSNEYVRICAGGVGKPTSLPRPLSEGDSGGSRAWAPRLCARRRRKECPRKRRATGQEIRSGIGGRSEAEVAPGNEIEIAARYQVARLTAEAADLGAQIADRIPARLLDPRDAFPIDSTRRP